ncbi:MBL fold metallo-hydrolase, partial [Pseudomonas sp. BGM005]|nr:MBL fold metallo-hydrolase [Pseudomonas sp. BG5]
GRRVRAVAGMVVAVVVAVFGARMLLDGPLASSTTPDGWSIAACDVGQGDALLVRSAGEVALIDTGPEPEPLAECLRSLGIDRIDLLVLTHFDLDHAGGVEALQGRVDEVVHGPTGERSDERTLDRLADGGATVTLAVAGMRGEVGGAEW